MSKDNIEQFVETLNGESRLRIESDLGDGFVRLRSAEAERRQAAHDIRSSEDIVIEMLRNARDAGARTIFLATTKEAHKRSFVMLDDGAGVPERLHTLIFEPRVTSKLDSMHLDKWGVHGRGMALYSIAVNSEEAFVVSSDSEKGTSLKVVTDIHKVHEKTDQSTFPIFIRDENNCVQVRGPKNIIRMATEFAVDSHKSCVVYFGSSTEIAAALFAYGQENTSLSNRAFYDSLIDFPVCLRLAFAADPAHFSVIADELGLPLSERSARRILDGTIKPPVALAHRVSQQLEAQVSEVSSSSAQTNPAKTNPLDSSRRAASLVQSSPSLKISSHERAALSESFLAVYQDFASSYYLDGAVEPRIRFSQGELQVTFPLRFPEDTL